MARISKRQACDYCDGELAYGRDWAYCGQCGCYRHIATNEIEHIATGLIQAQDAKGQPILLTRAAVSYLDTKRQATQKGKG